MHIKQTRVHHDIAIGKLTVAAFVLVLFAGLQAQRWLNPVALFARNSDTTVTRSSTETALVSNDTEAYSNYLQLDYYRSQIDKTISDFVASEPNGYRIYFKHLPSGLEVTSDPDSPITTASIYKLFAVLATLMDVDSAKLSLEQTLPDAGNRSIRQCIWDTITVSDNPCGRALRSITHLKTTAGLSRLRALGFLNTDMRGEYPQSSAHDVAMLLEHIYRGDLLSPSSNQYFLNALKAQQVNDRLPQGLAPGSLLAHKTGDLEGYMHDAGIVYRDDGNDYILVVMSEPDSGRGLGQRYQRFGVLMSRVETATAAYANQE